jgi:glycosyltransferase involved in cell wall biosynthesis
VKVAYVSFAPFISGAERSLQVMIESAPSVGIEPLLLCPPGATLIPWCEANGIRYVAVPLPDRDKRHPFRWFSSVVRVARVLRRERVDVVHSNQVWCMATAGAAARLLRIPRVCHMRDEVGVEGTRWWCKSGVEAVICISRHIEGLVSPAWSNSRRVPRIRTLINPVVLTMLDSLSLTVDENEREDEARARFGLTPGTVAFGFVGQIVAVKGVLELIHACRELANDPRWHLLIAGRDPHEGGEYEIECRRRVREWGLGDRVTFVGFLDDPTSFYTAIDAAVVPSLEEPLGRIPLEAAVRRRPAIAFATGGLTETITHGVTGWLVPAGNILALRAALRRALDDPAQLGEMGVRAHDAVVRKCAPGRYMQELATLYRDLLAARNGSRRSPPLAQNA